MMGSTLFYTTATSLSPLGANILTNMEVSKGKRYPIDTSVLINLAFIANNMGRANDPVSDDEHVTFLFYWLNTMVFCSRLIQIKLAAFLPLAALLTKGHPLCLAKFLLS